MSRRAASAQCLLPFALQGTSDSAGITFTAIASWFQLPNRIAWFVVLAQPNCSSSLHCSVLSLDSLSSVFCRAGGHLICSACPHITACRVFLGNSFYPVIRPLTLFFSLSVQLTHAHNVFIAPKQLAQMCLFLTQTFRRLSCKCLAGMDPHLGIPQ